MKVRRRKAQPWDGKTPLPRHLVLWMQQHPEWKLEPSKAVFPVCDAVRWGGHGHFPARSEEARIHRRVLRLPFNENHPGVIEARQRGLEPAALGHLVNLGGHPRLVQLGEHIIDVPKRVILDKQGEPIEVGGGLIHHGLQDISKWYEIGDDLVDDEPVTWRA